MSCLFKVPRWSFGLAAGLLLSLMPQVAIAGIFGGCLDDVTGGIKPMQVPNNCTANDVTFTAVGLGDQSDGCVNSGDTVTLFIGATLQNSGPGTRYDIGLYVATDGDPNNDGARTGSCYREILTPLGATGVSTCPPLDLDGGAGPFLDVDGDACGDLFNQNATGCDQTGPLGVPDGVWDDTFMVFTDALTLPCDDATADGFVEIPTASSWGNQIDEVGDGSCDSEAEVIPGTKAKCEIDNSNSTIPAPALGLTCGCDRTTLAPTESTTCTVTYNNPVTCTQDLTTVERFRCGTASFLRFEVDYDDANGATSSEAVTRGSVADNGDILTWVPASLLTTPGIIGPNGETASLTFDYTLDAGVPNGTTISLTTTSLWSDTSATDPAAVTQTALTCNIGLQSTPVTLAWARGGRDEEGTLVEWGTATEAGTLGFHLYEDRAGKPGRRLTARPVASAVTDTTEPQSYQVRLSDWRGNSFFIEDLDVSGESTLHGPFHLGNATGHRPQLEAVAWAEVRRQVDQASAQSLDRRSAAARWGERQEERAPTVDLAVDRPGFYRVSYEDLLTAGVDLSGVRARDLSLSSLSRSVPIEVSGGPVFGPGSSLAFLGEGLNTLYTDTNVYRLAVRPNEGSSIAVDHSPVPRKKAPPAFYMENLGGGRDALYAFSSPTGDPWYDTRMLVFQTPGSWSFDLPVDHLAPGAGPARLSVRIWGVTNFAEAPDHHIRALINGVVVAEEQFDGLQEVLLEGAVPDGILIDGTNTLTLELPGDTGALADLINLDSFELRYPRTVSARAEGLRFSAAGAAQAVSDLPHDQFAVFRRTPAGPVRLSKVRFDPRPGGFRALFAGTDEESEYLVAPIAGAPVAGLAPGRPPADLLAGTADYLILSHPVFLDSLGPLVAARQGDGLAVKVVNVDDVYNRYSGGVFDAHALSAYLSEAARDLGVRYVLLVGADTYDYQDALGLGSVSLLPSLYAATGGVVQFAPVDTLYGDIDGDQLPDLAVGRFPARTVEELQLLIDKTLAYETKSYDGTVVAAADGFDASGSLSFTQDSESFLAELPQGWSTQRAYLDTLGLVGARQRLLTAMDDGVALTSFIGHSGPAVWSFSGLFSAADAAALSNAGEPTVVLQWGCWNTYHVEPQFNTLGHSLLLSGDRGAAAVMGSSTLMASSSARALGERLAPWIAQPGMRLGDAILAAKRELAAVAPERLDVLLGWTLLGDPALVVEP